jgi:hypothetical protein
MPGESGDHQQKEQIDPDANNGRHNRMIEHDVTQSREIRVDLQSCRIQLNEPGPDFDEGRCCWLPLKK